MPARRLDPAAASRVFKETRELIFDPFFDNGGTDKGLFWHLSASLKRVALGYSLAAIAGIALGTLVGQAVWAIAGSIRSSRCCAPFRRWPGCRCRSRPSATASLRRSS